MLLEKKTHYYLVFFYLLLYSTPLVVGDSNCTCDHEKQTHDSKSVTLKYKIGAFVTILVASCLGVSLPIIGKTFPALHPESNLFFLIKSFAAGVILSTGFIHILPDAFEDLTSACLNDPWGNFPFTGLFAMVGALGSLMIDTIATGYYRAMHVEKSNHLDEEFNGAHIGHVHVHSHASHGHAHGPTGSGATLEGLSQLDRIRYKVTSQVLEMGIVVHSVIIGITLGTSESLKHIKALMVALCFHQFFEGVGLAGCIVQAAFKSTSTLCMALFFSLTTPFGIAIGIAITKGYNENSPSSLIIQGFLNSVAAGILIYMALVDLLAQDFMNPKVQSNPRLFLGANLTLLLGAGFMAILAYWA